MQDDNPLEWKWSEQWICPRCDYTVAATSKEGLRIRRQLHEEGHKREDEQIVRNDEIVPYTGVPVADKLHKINQADVKFLRGMKIRINFGEDYD